MISIQDFFVHICFKKRIFPYNRLNELRIKLGDDLQVISYESFVLNTETIVHKLQQFLGLHKPIPKPDVKTESMDKWKRQLSDEEINHIYNIVGFASDATKNIESTV